MAVTVNGTEIALTGDVGDYWYSDCITHTAVIEALAAVGRETDIIVHLNSGGGVATEGAAIHAALSAHKGLVNIIVEGWAASAASLIAMAGDKVSMAKGSVMMIHDPAAISWGPADTLRKDAATLDVLADSYAGVYADVCGKKIADVREIMKAETWYGPEDAVAAGFADEVLTKDSPEPTAFSGIAAYMRAPERITALAKSRGWNSRATMAAQPAATSSQGKEPPMTVVPEAGKENPATTTATPPAPPVPEHATPAAVAEACQAAGFPMLTAALLKAPVSMAAVEARISDAKAITDAAKTIGVPSMAGKLIDAGVSVEVARELLLDAKASIDEASPNDTANRNGPPQASGWDKAVASLKPRK
jgi:ATP-dependent Clp protease protease subunit